MVDLAKLSINIIVLGGVLLSKPREILNAFFSFHINEWIKVSNIRNVQLSIGSLGHN